MNHGQDERGEDEDIHKHVDAEPEKGIRVTSHPPWDPNTLTGLDASPSHVEFLPWMFWLADSQSPAVARPDSSSAERNCADEETQPKIPPCADIIWRAIRWNSGKYDWTQSDRTRHS